MRTMRLSVVAGILAIGLVIGGVATAMVGGGSVHAQTPTHATTSVDMSVGMRVPAYQHIFYVMMENHTYDEIIGNPAAPHINDLANEYGLATNYWGVSHPSEPNYVASVGGSYYGIQDDAFWQSAGHTLDAPNLGSQLEQAGLSWKTYQQSIPSDDTAKQSDFFSPDGSRLYATKHNPFLNFLGYYPPSQWTAELNKMVPDTQLATDLSQGTVPNLAYIVPDQCHDMHGTNACPTDATLIPAGDQYVQEIVQEVLRSQTWQTGNNAIVITWDENDFSPSTGVPGIASGGGHVPTIVITNHGPRGVQYSAPANHYSLLLTIQDAFHLGCLQNSCPATGNVQPMTALFRNSTDQQR